MTTIDVVIERDTANDEFATIVAIHVPSGSAVEQGELIFDVENSKATEEVLAPQSGVLVHDLEVGQMVSFGNPIGHIVAKSQLNAIADPQPMPEPAAAEVTAQPKPQADLRDHVVQASARSGLRRISHAAAEMLTQHGLHAANFDMDFITSQDVLVALGRQPDPLPPPSSAPAPSTPARSATAPPSHFAQHVPARTKQVEIETLSRGAGATMLSVLGTTLGQINVRRAAGAFLSGRITDLVIYEASRLMRKFPRLNAYYEDGLVYRYPAIHAGLAIDGGERLVVYGIADADTRNLADLSDAIADAVTRYAGKELTSGELSRATFTVTDLSADSLDFVFPLLPRGQTTIIGITRDDQSGYRLFAGFDHRVTEGREVAQFLGELRERLLSFHVAGSLNGALPCCAYCMRSSAEAVAKSRDRGLLKIVDRTGQEKLCCASCWNGW